MDVADARVGRAREKGAHRERADVTIWRAVDDHTDVDRPKRTSYRETPTNDAAPGIARIASSALNRSPGVAGHAVPPEMVEEVTS